MTGEKRETLQSTRAGVDRDDWDREVPPRLGPVPPVVQPREDFAHACLWIESAARVLEAQGMGADADALRRVLARVVERRRKKGGRQ